VFDTLIEEIFRVACFPIGWPLVRLVTLGKYPSKGSWLACTPEAEWTAAVGLAVLVVAGMVATNQFVLS
jgi:hypothetical protein